MPGKHAAYMVALFCFILLFSTQNVVIHDKVLKLCETELCTPVRCHQFDGYELFCLVTGKGISTGFRILKEINLSCLSN